MAKPEQPRCPAESELDDAIACTFPASDPVAVGLEPQAVSPPRPPGQAAAQVEPKPPPAANAGASADEPLLTRKP